MTDSQYVLTATASGFRCPGRLRITVSAQAAECPRGWLYATAVTVGADCAVLRPSGGGATFATGEEHQFTVVVPFAGAFEVPGTPLRAGPGLIRVVWTNPSRRFLQAVAEYLMCSGTGLTPAELRAGGLPVETAARAVRYEFARFRAEERAILSLRLRAHQDEGRLDRMRWTDLRSPFDEHARHLVCRYGQRIVGYVRVIKVDGDPDRSEYISRGGHQVPRRLWEEGFVEAGAGAMDPDFQRTGLFIPLMQQSVQAAVEFGTGHVLGACPDELLEMYCSMGFGLLESREVEPRAGWHFRSHLIGLDIDDLREGRCQGAAVPAMREAAASARRR